MAGVRMANEAVAAIQTGTWNQAGDMILAKCMVMSTVALLYHNLQTAEIMAQMAVWNESGAQVPPNGPTPPNPTVADSIPKARRPRNPSDN